MGNKINILVINWQCIKNPYGGGAEVHLHEIFKRIAGKGHSVTLLCCEVENEPKDEVLDDIKIIRRGSRNTFNFGVKREYLKLIKSFDYDIVIDDVNKIPFYTPRYVREPILGISHHFFGTSIFKEASLLAGLYVYIAEYLMKFVYKTTPFVVVSESTLDEFAEKGFDTSNYEIIYNAIAQEEYPMSVGEKYENPTITFFGRLKKYKSIDDLIRAFAILISKFPDAKLEILGRGDYEDKLKELCEELKIKDRVKFYGFISDEDKITLLSKTHIVVNTSLKEGWGITNIEANACGTPVISANSPGLRDSVKSGLSGELYEYGNINQLSEILIKYLSNKKILDEVSYGAVEWAKEFSWDNSADKMIKKIEKVILENQR